MANTIDADLLIDTLSEKVVTFLGPRLAPLRAPILPPAPSLALDPGQEKTPRFPKEPRGLSALELAQVYSVDTLDMTRAPSLAILPFAVPSASLGAPRMAVTLSPKRRFSAFGCASLSPSFTQ